MTTASERPALILLHGAVLNGRMWDPVVERLGGELTWTAPDLPGHGSRSNGRFTLAGAAALVHETARALGSQSIVLVGDSLGSYVAIAAAAGLGPRLAGAVLGGGTASFRSPMILTYWGQIALTRLIPEKLLLARLEARIPRDYPEAGGVVAARLRPAAFAEAVGELRRADFRGLLGGIRAPVLFVNGTRDWQHRLGERGALAACPSARLHHFDGSGHGVSLLRPADFADQIRQFVGRVVPPQR